MNSGAQDGRRRADNTRFFPLRLGLSPSAPAFPVGVSALRSGASLQILAYLAIPDASDAAALSQLSPRSPPFLANRFLSRKICIWGTNRAMLSRSAAGRSRAVSAASRACLCCPGQAGPRADMRAFVRAFVPSAAWS